MPLRLLEVTIPSDEFDRVPDILDGIKVEHVVILWSNQMNALCDDYQCVAMDTRGYNRSDKPDGVENYTMNLLTSDVAAVVDAVGGDDVTLIGHDFGGLIAWYFAMDERYRSKVARLVVINVTHPRGFSRALANQTTEQAEGSAYARVLIDPEQEAAALDVMTGAMNLRMETWWSGQDRKITEFVGEANTRTSPRSIVHYYQANYFREPYEELTGFPPVKMSVLQIHGLADPAVTKEGLAETWDWVDGEYTLRTFPGAGHIPQLAVPDRVNDALRAWLTAQ